MEVRYFDHAATTKLNEEVLNAMLPYLKNEYGNPSSIYSLGRENKKAIEDAREIVAKIFNADPKEIYFTGSGSEADNLAIRGVAYANRKKGNHIITSKIEHPAVLDTCKALEKEGFEVTYLNVDEDGIISLEELKNAITDKTILISIMFANNEIGTIEPIEEIGKIAKEHKVFFHTDAVQAVGNVAIDVNKLNIDLLSLSAHKFYGPKGVGALYARKNVKFEKIITGGHQERNKRAGTENVAGIIGLAKALEMAYEKLEENNKYLKELRDLYISEIEAKIPYVKLNGHREKRLPGNANFSFKCIEGESLLLNLDLKGICASSGSACTSGSLDPSHVLMAIGLSHAVAHGSLRITFGLDNTKEDVKYLVDNLVEIVERLRNMSPLYEDFINGDYVM
jgi:cysteine desulfurase